MPACVCHTLEDPRAEHDEEYGDERERDQRLHLERSELHLPPLVARGALEVTRVVGGLVRLLL